MNDSYQPGTGATTGRDNFWAEVERSTDSLLQAVGRHGREGSGGAVRPGPVRVMINGSRYVLQARQTARGDRPVVLVVARPEPGSRSRVRARNSFGLTASEARVATLLAARMTNREIARELGRSEHTARRHTEKVLRKLGVRRRSDVRAALAACTALQVDCAPRSAPAAESLE